MKIRFPLKDVPELAAAYDKRTKSLARGKDWERELEIVEVLVPKVRRAGFLDRDDFLKVCRWKSPRPLPHYSKNSSEIVREVTKVALHTDTAPILKIGILTLLRGVKWPMASVFLHFFDREQYPILESMALADISFPGVQNPHWKA